MTPHRILFICMHNSARSQMATALVNRLCGDKLAAESAGLEPGKLNPLVGRVLGEDGTDISQNQTRSVDDVLRAGGVFDHIVTVCSEAESEGCPIFPGTGCTGRSMIRRNLPAAKTSESLRRAGCVKKSAPGSCSFALR